LQHGGSAPDERRVPFVHEAIKVSATPSELGREFRIELPRNAAKVSDRDLLDATTFDQRDEPAGHPGARGEVVLSPAEPVSQGSIAPADLNVVHRGMVSRLAYRRVNRKLGSPYPAIVRPGSPCDVHSTLRPGSE
jgi:hypothetical protein